MTHRLCRHLYRTHHPLTRKCLSRGLSRTGEMRLRSRPFTDAQDELALLSDWLLEQHCRVVSVLGMGGIGKSTLAVTLMHRVADQFDAVIWRSLRDAPPCESLLDELLRVLAGEPLTMVLDTLERRLTLLFEYLRTRRVLLVLDNLESVMEEAEGSGRMIARI